MTEKRASTASGSYAKAEPKGADPLARLSDHLGRLLGHADELLAEWQGHADGVRARLDVQAREAAAAFEEAVAGALAEAGSASAAQLEKAFGASAAKLRGDLERARQAAADLDAHMQRIAGGARPTSVDELRTALGAIAGKLDALRRGPSGTPGALVLGVTANLLVLAVLVVVWMRTADRPVAPIAAPPPPAPAAPVLVPDAPPAPPPVTKPCTGLAGDSAAKLVAECVAHVCGVRLEPPLKPGGYARVLGACRPEDPAARDLVAALQSLERDKVLEKLACPPEKDGAVTVRWLLDCSIPPR